MRSGYAKSCQLVKMSEAPVESRSDQRFLEGWILEAALRWLEYTVVGDISGRQNRWQ